MHDCCAGNGQCCFLSLLEKIIGRNGIKQQHKRLNSYLKRDPDKGIIKYVKDNLNVFSRG